MDYFISFNGHLVEKTRPDGWPKVIKDQFVIRAETAENLANFLNQKADSVQRNGGLNVILEKDILDIALSDDEKKSDPRFGFGIFVPMHMISYLTFTVRPTTAPMISVEEGAVLQ